MKRSCYSLVENFCFVLILATLNLKYFCITYKDLHILNLTYLCNSLIFHNCLSEVLCCSNAELLWFPACVISLIDYGFTLAILTAWKIFPQLFCLENFLSFIKWSLLYTVCPWFHQINLGILLLFSHHALCLQQTLENTAVMDGIKFIYFFKNTKEEPLKKKLYSTL